MTSIVPGYDRMTATGSQRAWLADFSPANFLALDLAQANIRMFEAVLQLMLLPLAATTGGLSAPAAPTPVTPEPADFVTSKEPQADPAPALASVERIADVAAKAPALLDQPDGKPDDLLRIKGIGPKLNQLLNSLGVWHYRQIVSWTPAEISWINAKIDSRSRIQRERWQPQAAELMKTRKAA